jgi:hypothetical protein
MCGKIHIHWENDAKRISKMWEQTAGILSVITSDKHVTLSDSKWLTFEKLRFISKKHKRGRCGLRNNRHPVSISI